MNERSAREVLLLQAFESVVPASADWGEDDKVWATRLALQDAPRGAAADAEAFLACRARHAMQRLLPRQPSMALWLARRLWRPLWLVAAVIGGAVLGLLADSIGSSQRINLLAPPVWTVVAWNFVVYVLLIGGAVRWGFSRRRVDSSGGGLRRLTGRLMRIGRRLPGVGLDRQPAGDSDAVLRGFGARWLQASAPLAGRRAALLLHAGAAALGVGLIAGLYARGLVLDYRADWESTFLSAAGVHAVLATLLAPAIWLSGIAVPDAAGFAALRAVHGVEGAGASAAPWIHLYAVTLLLVVVVPRVMLATFSAWQARRLANDFPLPLSDPYFQRLLRQQSGELACVQVLPYARDPSAADIAGLRRVLADVLGDRTTCDVAATTAFGLEDEAVATMQRLPAATTHLVALFDLTATPEAEHHGAFVQALANHAPAGAATVCWVDEAVFRQRFGASGNRLAERRAAWKRLADALGTVAVIADPEAADTAVAAGALQAAIARPVHGADGPDVLNRQR